MAISTVLTDKIRFPEGTNIEDTWINNAEVQVNEETGTYTIIRHHGPQAGSEVRPVYMGEDGQPVPILHTINADVPSDAVFGIEGIITEDIEPPKKLKWGDSFTAVGDMEIDGSTQYVTKLVLQKYTLPYPTVAVEETLTSEQEAAADIWIKLDSGSSVNPDTEETNVAMAYGETYDIINSIEVSSSGKVLSITKGQIILPYASTLVAASVPAYNNDAVIWINPNDHVYFTDISAFDFSEFPVLNFDVNKTSYTIKHIDIVATNGQTLSLTPDTLGAETVWYPDENGEWGSHGEIPTPRTKPYFTYTVERPSSSLEMYIVEITFDAHMVCEALGIESNDTGLTFKVYS